MTLPTSKSERYSQLLKYSAIIKYLLNICFWPDLALPGLKRAMRRADNIFILKNMC